jgi:uncharacterized membrane protein YccC
MTEPLTPREKRALRMFGYLVLFTIVAISLALTLPHDAPLHGVF